MQNNAVRRYATARQSQPPSTAAADRTRLIGCSDGHSKHPQFGKRNNEPTATIAVVCELIHDLIGKIPGQDQDDVRLSPPNLVGRHDLKIGTRYEQAVLERVKVGNIFEFL